MNRILLLQSRLQSTYAKMDGYPLLNPVDFQDYTVGQIYDFIRHKKFCLNEELTELMEELGDGSRNIHKPWSPNYFTLRNRMMKSTPGMLEEAIDSLCFLMNILLAVGITPENLEDEYDKVFAKNTGRIKNYYGQKAKLERQGSSD